MIQIKSDIKAVVLADSFQTRFFPLTQEVPKVLFPVVNEIMIEYPLNWLLNNGIKDVIILYQAKREQIEKYFSDRQANRKGKTQEIKLIHTEDSKSVGDALRELHSHNLIHTDFILLSADTLCNYNLQSALRFYYEKKEQSKSNIMTVIVRQRKSSMEPFAADEDFYLYTIDHQNTILQLQNMSERTNVQFNNEKIRMEKGQSKNAVCHSNLVDSDIYICSFDVLNGFQENIMLNNIKDDFMREILNSEIKEERFHLYQAPITQFSIRIRTPKLYYNAMQLLLQGTLKPYAPNNTWLKQPYNQEDLFKYFGNNVKCITAKISNSCCIGHKTIVGNNSVIEKSIIGSQCRIGENCQIKNSIIWDDVIIYDNVVINDSLVASNVIIGSNVLIERGSIVSFKVELKPNVKVQEMSRIGCFNQISGKENEMCVKGFVYNQQDQHNTSFFMGFQQNILQHLSEETLRLGDEGGKEVQEVQQKSGKEKDDYFNDEMRMLIFECQDNPDSVSSAILQVQTMKINENKSMGECVFGFTQPILIGLLDNKYETSQEIIIAIKSKITVWKEFLIKYVNGDQETHIFIDQIEDFCRKNISFQETLHLFFQCCFQNGIIKSSNIMKWYEFTLTKNDALSKQFIKLNAKFIDWLKAQEEDEEEEDDEEEEVEEDEEEDEAVNHDSTVDI